MTKAPTMVFADQNTPPTWLSHTTIINGSKWIVGRGPVPANVMIIGDHPSKDDLETSDVFTGKPGQILIARAEDAGLNLRECYMTNVLKFMPRGKNPKTGDFKLSLPLLEEEVNRVNPKIIICLGKHAVFSIFGKGYSLSDYHGSLLQHPNRPDTKVFITYAPSYILWRPDAARDYAADWKTLKRLLEGKSTEAECTEFAVYHTAKEVRGLRAWLFEHYESPILVLDCEWNGQHHMDPHGYLRTVQIGYDIGKAIVIELRNTDGSYMVSQQEESSIFKELKFILEDPRARLVGHHLRADGKWLLSYGVDVRPQTWADTMVYEHTINSTGPFGLTELTLRYTQMGKYDKELVEWVNDNQDMCKHGYGAVPRDLLIPYAASDVDAPRRILEEQQKELGPYFKPRGDYPSIADIDMHTSKILYELEWTGLRVDRKRLSQMIELYHTRRDQLEITLVNMAKQLGLDDFNFRSPPQVAHLLFDTLDLTPVRTTGRVPWERVMLYEEELQEDINPSTDKETLTILADVPGAHPIVAMLRDMRKIEYVCTQWLVPPDIAERFDYTTRGGGLLAKMWPDGRLHANFSQLKETARFSSSKPNVQNWMKRAEGELKRIIGDDLVGKIFGNSYTSLPSMRSIIVPTPGYVLMEADWKQAEMFVLAALSGDKTMWDALTTPGRDLHDLTAITAFNITVYGPDGKPVPDEFLLELAARDPNWDASDSEFNKFQNQLIYIDSRGRRLTRGEFKSGIRVSAKNLNFGIPYGRGPLDIAIQVKAETGVDAPIQQLADEIRQMTGAWKEITYPSAWGYMEACAGTVTNPGYLENPWERRRKFPWPPVTDRDLIAKLGREAQNYPIQSTVADTCLIALWMMAEYRKKSGLHFRIVNQIHDAILVEAPENEIEQTKQMFYDTMGSIQIPIPNRPPLQLDVDIDIMRRWGEK